MVRCLEHIRQQIGEYENVKNRDSLIWEWVMYLFKEKFFLGRGNNTVPKGKKHAEVLG